MKVFVIQVSEDFDLNHWIDGIFSSKEKALEYLKKYEVKVSVSRSGEPCTWEEKTRFGSVYYSLSEWDLDKESTE